MTSITSKSNCTILREPPSYSSASQWYIETNMLELNQTNYSLLYCNGIEATEAQAIEQGEIISKAFGGRAVSIFYNPTKVKDFVTFDDAQRDKIAELANLLAKTIVGLKQTHPWASRGRSEYGVLLFAHSHGAYIVKEALFKVDIEERQHVRVYTFGAITMIPKRLAQEVHNYVFGEDMIARTGNKAYDPYGVLDRIMQIRTRMRLENLSLRQAIINQCTEETYIALDDVMQSSEKDGGVRAFKADRFRKTFFEGKKDAIEKETIQTALQKYTSCFTNYNVEILQTPSKKESAATQKTSSETEDLDLDKMSADTAQTMCDFGKSSLTHHVLPAFTQVIEKIAKEKCESKENEK